MKKTAIISGGVRRLGGEISRHLLDSGYQVFSINSVTYFADEFPILKHPDFKSIQLNLETATKQDLENSLHEISQVDLLVNNASIMEETPFNEITDEIWERFFSINLKSVFFLSQTLSKKMKKQTSESNIINIIDSGGDLLWTKYFVYNLTKNNLLHLTKLLAKELAPEIRVNGIAPGTIIPFENANESWINSAKKRSVLNRIGDPSEILGLIDVILKSKFMTGSILTVDGGRSLL